MKKRTICLLLAMIMVLSIVLAGCSKTAETPAADETPATTEPAETTDNTETPEAPEETAEPALEQKTIQLMITGAGKQANSDKVWAAFNEQLQQYVPNTTVEFIDVPFEEYSEKFSQVLASGEGVDLAWTGWLINKPQNIADGNLMPLDDLLAEYGQGIVDILGENVVEIHRNADDGKLYYVPTSISAFGLYCNLELLEEHGQPVPATWPEFTAVCDHFVQQGITPVIANNDISLKTLVLAKGLYPIYQSQDPPQALRHFNNGEADLAQALRPGFDLVEEMITSHYIDCAAALQTEKTQDDLTQFARGQAPFMLSGAWAAPRLREAAPDLDFAVYPYPVLTDGSVLVINVDTRLSVNAHSPHLAAAKDFVQYLTQPEVLWEFVNSPDGTTMAFLTLSMVEIFHSLNMRSRRGSIFALKTRNNFLFGAMVVSLILTTAVIEVPFLAAAFEFTPIGLHEYAIALGLAVLIIPIMEVVKAVQRKLGK